MKLGLFFIFLFSFAQAGVTAETAMESQNTAPLSEPQNSILVQEPALLPQSPVLEPEAPKQVIVPDQESPGQTQGSLDVLPNQQPQMPSPELTEEEKILASPTSSLEEYEKVRKKIRQRLIAPDSSFSFMVIPEAFSKAEFRVPSTTTDSSNAKLMGFLIGGERILTHSIGTFGVGLEAGFYGNVSGNKKDFVGAVPLMLITSLAPVLQYQGVFTYNQWLAPSLRTSLDIARHDYKFKGRQATGIHVITHFDVGLIFYLNVLEPSAASQLDANYSIRRTYLTAHYGISIDRQKPDFDLSERAWKVGFRFEF